jgi:hypothetical protein
MMRLSVSGVFLLVMLSSMGEVMAQAENFVPPQSDYLHGSTFMIGISGGSFMMNHQPPANHWLQSQKEPILQSVQPAMDIYVAGFINRIGLVLCYGTNSSDHFNGLDYNAFKPAIKYKLLAQKNLEIHAGLGVDIYWSDIRFKEQPARLLYFNYPDNAYLEQVNSSVSPSLTFLHQLSRTKGLLKYIYIAGEVGYHQMLSYGVWRYGYYEDSQDNSYYRSFPIGSYIGNSIVSGAYFNIHLGCSFTANFTED